MNISILNIDKLSYSECYKYISLASQKKQKEIAALKSENNKKIALLSHLFARYEISKRLSVPFSEIVFFFNEHGKPYIKNNNFHFSVSHSGSFIAFASNNAPIGLDIQKISDKISPAIRFFTSNEKEYIKDSPERFFEIWTKKEAYVKMLGTGLSTPFASFDVLSPPVNDMLFSTAFLNYEISICTKEMSKLQVNSKLIN